MARSGQSPISQRHRRTSFTAYKAGKSRQTSWLFLLSLQMSAALFFVLLNVDKKQTRKFALEVAPTTLARGTRQTTIVKVHPTQNSHRLTSIGSQKGTFSSNSRELRHMTLTFEHALDMVKLNQLTKYLGQRSFSSKGIVWSGHTPTHTGLIAR